MNMKIEMNINVSMCTSTSARRQRSAAQTRREDTVLTQHPMAIASDDSVFVAIVSSAFLFLATFLPVAIPTIPVLGTGGVVFVTVSQVSHVRDMVSQWRPTARSTWRASPTAGPSSR